MTPGLDDVLRHPKKVINWDSTVSAFKSSAVRTSVINYLWLLPSRIHLLGPGVLNNRSAESLQVNSIARPCDDIQWLCPIALPIMTRWPLFCFLKLPLLFFLCVVCVTHAQSVSFMTKWTHKFYGARPCLLTFWSTSVAAVVFGQLSFLSSKRDFGIAGARTSLFQLTEEAFTPAGRGTVQYRSRASTSGPLSTVVERSLCCWAALCSAFQLNTFVWMWAAPLT